MGEGSEGEGREGGVLASPAASDEQVNVRIFCFTEIVYDAANLNAVEKFFLF